MPLYIHPPPCNQSAMFGIQIWLCHSLDFCCGNKQRILIESVKSWTARRSNQPVLKEINPQYSLECLMLKLKLQYFGHLMRKRPWCWERLKVGGKGDDRGWDGWMASPTQWTWVWVNSRSWRWTGGLECCSPWGHKELDMTERLNWSDPSLYNMCFLICLF